MTEIDFSVDWLPKEFQTDIPAVAAQYGIPLKQGPGLGLIIPHNKVEQLLDDGYALRLRGYGGEDDMFAEVYRDDFAPGEIDWSDSHFELWP
jgi:hypothetical protein